MSSVITGIALVYVSVTAGIGIISANRLVQYNTKVGYEMPIFSKMETYIIGMVTGPLFPSYHMMIIERYSRAIND